MTKYYRDESPKDRFYKKFVKLVCGCWEWADCLREGYGRLWVNQHFVNAHRFSWELYCGEIPEDMCVLHKCDNRKCVNPDHLFLGTRIDNNKDRDDKNRQIAFKGEDHYNSRLSKLDVLEIRRLYSTGKIKQVILSKMFKVRQAHISGIIRRKAWKHI